VLSVSERGQGKRSELDEYRLQTRGGKGIITMKVTEKTGGVVGVAQVGDDDEVMLVTDRGRLIRLRVSDIRVTGRNAQGVKVREVGGGERGVRLGGVVEAEERNGAAGEARPADEGDGEA